MQQQFEEERTNRLLQEEAVKFLWKQVSSALSSLNNSPSVHIKAIKNLCAAVMLMLTWKTEEIIVCGTYDDCIEMNSKDTVNCQT